MRPVKPPIENTNLGIPSDLTVEILQQYNVGEYFGSAAADKMLGAAGSLSNDIGSMNNGGWETIALALKAANTGPTPVPTATSDDETSPDAGGGGLFHHLPVQDRAAHAQRGALRKSGLH